jgi:hypothetical protein
MQDRLAIFADRFGKLGAAVNRAAVAFNEALGSFEQRLLPQARRIRELGASGTKELPELEPVEERAREPMSPSTSLRSQPLTIAGGRVDLGSGQSARCGLAGRPRSRAAKTGRQAAPASPDGARGCHTRAGRARKIMQWLPPVVATRTPGGPSY